ncbi:helix-hairpin-helix domain-containing protein [Robiginitalea sp. SC105]|uniref:helix-hairpin-helix domain-containing protein n=1 Tax=Robiginitalea sp. SC105 TaxID=2762332 RepID=UPI00163A5725|nr:helix-hairpin-helix domain-containing protein [Robiginitalea sp. SC105]MBC2839213.1 Pathogenicity locus [Robiginitalea sp. SC105]
MKTRFHPVLNLTDSERKGLRAHGVKIREIPDYATDELEVILGASPERADLLRARAEFQQIPSVGIHFADDLYFLGYRRIQELRGLDGATLTDTYEFRKGYRTDPCVEDQFRLAVHYAKTGDSSRRWWDFTAERKAFRETAGYPENRPEVSYFDLLQSEN